MLGLQDEALLEQVVGMQEVPGKTDVAIVRLFRRLAERCMDRNHRRRPTMGEVFVELRVLQHRLQKPTQVAPKPRSKKRPSPKKPMRALMP